MKEGDRFTTISSQYCHSYHGGSKRGGAWSICRIPRWCNPIWDDGGKPLCPKCERQLLHYSAVAQRFLGYAPDFIVAPYGKREESA